MSILFQIITFMVLSIIAAAFSTIPLAMSALAISLESHRDDLWHSKDNRVNLHSELNNTGLPKYN